jgi:hypothetical protein
MARLLDAILEDFSKRLVAEGMSSQRAQALREILASDKPKPDDLVAALTASESQPGDPQ